MDEILVIYDFIQQAIVPLTPAIVAMPSAFEMIDVRPPSGRFRNAVADFAPNSRQFVMPSQEPPHASMQFYLIPSLFGSHLLRVSGHSPSGKDFFHILARRNGLFH